LDQRGGKGVDKHVDHRPAPDELDHPVESNPLLVVLDRPALCGDEPRVEGLDREHRQHHDRREERFHPESAAVPLLDPVQELGQAVDLVVVPPLGELQQFGAEVLEPFCPERQVYMTGLDLGGLGVHPSHFVGLGHEGDRIWHAGDVFTTESWMSAVPDPLSSIIISLTLNLHAWSMIRRFRSG
jgi:hypothetical protein